MHRRIWGKFYVPSFMHGSGHQKHSVINLFRDSETVLTSGLHPLDCILVEAHFAAHQPFLDRTWITSKSLDLPMRRRPPAQGAK